MMKGGKQGGFTLIEIVAAAALLGVLLTMLMPSLEGANEKVKNAKLKNDLAAVDQALQLYKLENGTLPEGLTELDGSYLAKGSDFKDALNEDLTYTVESDGLTYTLKGKNAADCGGRLCNRSEYGNSGVQYRQVQRGDQRFYCIGMSHGQSGCCHPAGWRQQLAEILSSAAVKTGSSGTCSRYKTAAASVLI